MGQKTTWQNTFQQLKQKRDELRLKLNLGKREAQDAWEDVEKNFGELEAKIKTLQAQGEEETDRLGEDIELLVSDIRDGFDRLRNRAK